MKAKFLFSISIIIFFAVLPFAGCENSNRKPSVELDYNDPFTWVYMPDSVYATDVFFVAPTVFLGNDSTFNMDISNEELRLSFAGAVNMEKGIYDEQTNFYAPYYRQASLMCYEIRGYNDVSSNVDVKNAFERAYDDVSDAFSYYLSISDRPFILAGFSQGSELLLKLMKDRLGSRELQERMIAAYLIGWRVTVEDIKKSPHLKPAKTEDDKCVFVCFSTEAPFIDKSLIVPYKTLSINPLNWKTDSTFAGKSLNKGAVFTDYDGNITKEIPELTGAYICPHRGTLKATDINPDDYPPVLDIFESGEYHIYDYMFFYRNLQENVKARMN